MPTQKIFKQRVRARMTKTGESYTAARSQLLPRPPNEAPAPAAAFLVADESMVRSTGKGHTEWFALLDTWGATAHNHTEIARWLGETHSVPSWWTQNVTVAYERARGMRARYQMRDGFSVSVTRTVAVAPEWALEAFSSPTLRQRWLPDAPMTQRPTRAASSARFDWSDPPSRVIVSVVPKGTDKAVVAVAHEQLPDAESGERLKGAWRAWLGALKATLEQG